MHVSLGRPFPLGATSDHDGVNFAVTSSCATRVEVCLFDTPDDSVESTRWTLPGRTGDVWHGHATGLRPGQLYAYRVHGPWDPGSGQRCNPTEILFDPYARAVGRPLSWDPWRPPLGAVADPAFDWDDDHAPRTPWTETVIYELHVKGFTALHPDVPPTDRGTYRGLANDAAIAHLRDLGVTAVELMPVHARVDEWALHLRGLSNYWGYNTLGFFAPEPRLAAASDPVDVVREFKTMVKALHAAGLEVILDVVYNHTAEGNRLGPTLSMRGIDNANYYRLQPDDRSRYEDFSGCGNTLDTRSPVVQQLIIDSLRYWIDEMHVDGFRFDLASALLRGDRGVDLRAPLLEAIAKDPVIAQAKLIAEPWDATMDGYRVGHFPAEWSEWNGRYRDSVRRVWRGDAGQRAELATRLAGSSDLYDRPGRSPRASINFITAHDGFTLADLVSYNRKRNEDNGEQNADGESNNFSENWGAEGASADPTVVATRRRVQRSLLLTLLTSQGVPMLSGGDELGRTQAGNNNAYCHDSVRSWTPWLESQGADLELLAFTRRALALRRAHPQLRRASFLTGLPDPTDASAEPDVTWLGPSGEPLTETDWHAPEERVLGMWLRDGADSLLVLLNPSNVEVNFRLPTARGVSWTLALALSSVDDASDGASTLTESLSMPPHSAAVIRHDN